MHITITYVNNIILIKNINSIIGLPVLFILISIISYFYQNILINI